LQSPKPGGLLADRNCSTNKSSVGKKSSASTRSPSGDGKPMHVIAKEVKQTDSRIKSWATGSADDDPFIVGKHHGLHIFRLNDQMIDVTDMFKNIDDNSH
jgi:hypothetical protein